MVASPLRRWRRWNKIPAFKIFLLGAMAGLRRNEIDKLPWSAFRWDEGVIHIQAPNSSGPRAASRRGTFRLTPG